MIIETNEKLIRRNSRIGQYAMVAGLLVLVGGMVISFRYEQYFNLSLVALLLGFLLSQVGIYFSNRWGRRPRPDELLNQALKGLDNKYALYHYQTPAAHLLVGPAGVWVLAPRHQRGTITYEKGRYRQKGGGLLMGYLKLFAQEGLGRPDLEILGEAESIHKFLAKILPENESPPPVQAALIFTNPDTEIVIDENANPPAETMHLSKLKDFIRKKAKSKPIPQNKAQELQALIAGAIK